MIIVLAVGPNKRGSTNENKGSWIRCTAEALVNFSRLFNTDLLNFTQSRNLFNYTCLSNLDLGDYTFLWLTSDNFIFCFSFCCFSIWIIFYKQLSTYVLSIDAFTYTIYSKKDACFLLWCFWSFYITVCTSYNNCGPFYIIRIVHSKIQPDVHTHQYLSTNNTSTFSTLHHNPQ